MEMLLPILGGLVPAIPSIIVDVVLLTVAVARWDRHPQVSMLAAASGVLLLVLDVLVRTFFIILPMKLHESGTATVQISVIFSIVSGVSGLLHAVATGLLVAAVFAERNPVTPARGPPSFSER